VTASILPLLLLTVQPDPSAFLSPIERGVMACTEVADGAARLACFDRTARPLRELSMGQGGAALAVPREAAPEGVEAPVPAASAEPYPSYEAASAPRTEARERGPVARARERAAEGLPVGVPVAELAFGPYDKALITLANGEVWEQLSSDSVILRVSQAQAEGGLTATVKPGALGSRRMTIEPIGKTIRVRAKD
jgi:hypothetical protein